MRIFFLIILFSIGSWTLYGQVSTTGNSKSTKIIKKRKSRIPLSTKTLRPSTKLTNINKPTIDDPSNVTDLLLSQTEVPFNCKTSDTQCIQIIDVATVAASFGRLEYIYKVSGGRVFGNGSNVKWDLTGVPPGTYLITAAVDDGRGALGMTKTKAVKVVE